MNLRANRVARHLAEAILVFCIVVLSITVYQALEKEPEMQEELITFLAYDGRGEVSVRPEDIMGLEDLPETENCKERTRIDMRSPEKGRAQSYLVKQSAAYIRRAMCKAKFRQQHEKEDKE